MNHTLNLADPFVDKILAEKIQELNKYFGFKLGYEPKIFILPDRKTIQLYRRTIEFYKNENTPKWLDAWTYNKEIFIHLQYINLSPPPSRTFVCHFLV